MRTLNLATSAIGWLIALAAITDERRTPERPGTMLMSPSTVWGLDIYVRSHQGTDAFNERTVNKLMPESARNPVSARSPEAQRHRWTTVGTRKYMAIFTLMGVKQKVLYRGTIRQINSWMTVTP
ncbi:hypothetical protein BDM02DRAFT_1758678 [Thelephora ganbajun]|uniref:Uncharacterized protein n=1 Tax=Thelephora ganbajun TaxID=370292 RepID=A0ACB6Z0J5_THEGA|nr:hypothetical protein BDM02DRAFT_1758678 [Thelephora ganbajun]